MVAVESVRAIPCPSCAGDDDAVCDRCDNQRVIAVVDPPVSTKQAIAEGLRKIREKLQ